MDSSMNNLLKWSIENSAPTTTATDGTTPAPAPRSLSPTALHRLLLNAPSDAELMKNAMAAIRSPTTTLDDKLIAFDNFEQLVENLDNANNLGVLGLWEPLVQELEAAEAGRRMMGAWCIGTAVQNNAGAQEMVRLLLLSFFLLSFFSFSFSSFSFVVSFFRSYFLHQCCSFLFFFFIFVYVYID